MQFIVGCVVHCVCVCVCAVLYAVCTKGMIRLRLVRRYVRKEPSSKMRVAQKQTATKLKINKGFKRTIQAHSVKAHCVCFYVVVVYVCVCVNETEWMNKNLDM